MSYMCDIKGAKEYTEGTAKAIPWSRTWRSGITGDLDTRTIEESQMPYSDSSPIPTRRRMITDCTCDADHRDIITHRATQTDGGCWTWTGRLNREGYGVVYHLRSWQAHRLSYVAFRGPIPAGRVMDHLCRNPSCVNPDHLEAVTDRENILRGEGIAAHNARKTECIRGHSEWSEVSVARVCLACAREKQAAKAEKGVISGDPSDPRHGTTNGYGNLGCRCDRCCKANTDRHRAYMRHRRTATNNDTAQLLEACPSCGTRNIAPWDVYQPDLNSTVGRYRCSQCVETWECSWWTAANANA